MRIGLMIAFLMIVLSACTGNTQSLNRGHNTVSGVMGVPVKDISAYGFVTQIAVEKRVINIKHAPIPEMNWAPMVMNFNVTDEVDLTPFKRGMKVQFILEVDKDDNFRVKDIAPMTK